MMPNASRAGAERPLQEFLGTLVGERLSEAVGDALPRLGNRPEHESHGRRLQTVGHQRTDEPGRFTDPKIRASGNVLDLGSELRQQVPEIGFPNGHLGRRGDSDGHIVKGTLQEIRRISGYGSLAAVHPHPGGGGGESQQHRQAPGIRTAGVFGDEVIDGLGAGGSRPRTLVFDDLGF